MNESDDRTAIGEDILRIEMVPVSVHERNLRSMRCVISAHTQVTLHHCKGGSMLEIVGGNPGMGKRVNPFFQIPIHQQYHTGEYGIDTGMGKIKSTEQWEESFGTQVEFLEEVNGLLPYSIWIQAGMWMAEHGELK